MRNYGSRPIRIIYNYCNIPPYALTSQLQTKIYSTTPTTIATVAMPKNLRRSKMIPTIPNIKAARTERFISNPPRAARGLPQPGWSIIIAPAVRVATTSNVIAIFPKRIFSFPKNPVKISHNLIISLINWMFFQITSIADAPGYSNAVKIVEQWNGILSGGIKQILKLYTFQFAFFTDEWD